MCKKLINLGSFVLVLGLVLTSIANAVELDPNFLAWWPLNEGSENAIIDVSGSGNDGTIHNVESGGLGPGGSAWFNDPERGMVLSFNGDDTSGTYVSTNLIVPAMTMKNGFTWAFWAKQQGDGSFVNAIIIGNRHGGTPSPLQFIKFTPTRFEFYHGEHSGTIYYDDLPDSVWIHMAVVKDGATLTHYRNGEIVDISTITATNDENPFFMGGEAGGERWAGRLSDVRLYTKALTYDELQDAMAGGGAPYPYAAGPKPGNDETEVSLDTSLSWRNGVYAEKHHVYFGSSLTDVNEATLDDPRGVLLAKDLDVTSHEIPALEYNQTYYWRVDEVNGPPDFTVFKGTLWSFTTRNFILVDDFEAYDDVDYKIYDRWEDGWEDATNGSVMGYVEPDFDAGKHYVETGKVYGGTQSGPLTYDNTSMKYSEVWLSESWPLLSEDIDTLSLYFLGNYQPLGSFVEDPAGTYTMRAAGTDIFGTADEFHFAYKEITGSSTIRAKVESLEDTTEDGWAKAGVMIRDELTIGSPYSSVLLTPGNGVRNQYRSQANATTERVFDVNIVPPYWVRAERTSGGLVRAYISPNGNDPWTRFPLRPIQMTGSVYVGLAVTSHEPDMATEAVFSNVTMTGTGSDGQWQHQDIGIASNLPQPIYAALNNTPVYYRDPNTGEIDLNATQIKDDWVHFEIELQEFIDKGVDVSNVTSLAVGVGHKTDTSGNAGDGTLYLDDIRFYRP